jgi:hypothetical protein
MTIRSSLFLLVGLAACAEPVSSVIDDPLTGGGKADGAKGIVPFDWEGPTNVFPATLEPADANFDANHCELWVNGFGRGSFSNGGASATWLEAYVSVPPQDGEVRAVGMFARTAPDEPEHLVMLGREIERDYWRTGITLSRSFGNEQHDVLEAAFFVDIERDGEVLRFWQSRRGANFSIDDTFALPPSATVSIGGGAVSYANERALIFDQKHTCD